MVKVQTDEIAILEYGKLTGWKVDRATEILRHVLKKSSVQSSDKTLYDLFRNWQELTDELV